MFRYRLRTLVILVTVLPPLLAWSWLVGAAVMAEYRVGQADEWEEVGGPGIIAKFPASCDFGMEASRDEASTSTSP